MSMKKKLGKLVARIIAEGREINIGPHVGLAGYHARVYVPQDLDECEECEQPLLGHWDTCGHGWTPLEALENGFTLAKGNSLVFAATPVHFTEEN